MDFDKWTSAGYLANHMARLFAQGIHARIRPLGLSPGNFPALLELWVNDGLTQKELTERLSIEQATMANTLARMERDGLIRRTPHPADGRSQQIWLTAKAKALEAPAIEAAKAQNNLALARLDPAERAQFVAMMTTVIETMRAAQDEADGPH
ncbi:MarR family winged helix-turn-helix transcriptional regulator [Amorphus sp. 3PC139-8]|uniref:MarR family winged helix-turn-helix transcriptional regulator n=1 Tax=Amorphus sp. 3PC139-8 TaxID=2735676 RepID=UPI00345DBC6C